MSDTLTQLCYPALLHLSSTTTGLQNYFPSVPIIPGVDLYLAVFNTAPYFYGITGISMHLPIFLKKSVQEYV